MKCKKAQDLILTDYLDGRMQEGQKNQIQRHLEQCKECRQFEISARKHLLQPFHETAKFNPPQEIWDNIKAHIETQNQSLAEDRVAGLWEKLKVSFHLPRPAFMLATLTVMIFAGVLFTRVFLDMGRNPATENFSHLQYLLSLTEQGVQPSNLVNEGYGTEIEEFFL